MVFPGRETQLPSNHFWNQWNKDILPPPSQRDDLDPLPRVFYPVAVPPDGVMDLEFHQIDLPYEHLRRRAPEAERQLLASLAADGQKVPVVVLALGQDRYALLDGHKRYRALHQLKRDTLQAVLWDLGEVDALLLERMMRSSDPDSPLEQAWFLRANCVTGSKSLQRNWPGASDRTPSWVSRRLALVEELPGRSAAPRACWGGSLRTPR